MLKFGIVSIVAVLTGVLLVADPTSQPSATSQPAAAAAPTSQPAPTMTDKQQASYTLGFLLARQIEYSADELDFTAMARGIEVQLRKGKPALTMQQMQAAFMKFQQHQDKIAKAKGAKGRAAGAAFLAANAKKPGVKQLPSGLQFKVIKEGTGRTPNRGETVVVHYTGTLIDGTVFDSSRKGAQPAEFELGRVIKGWNEGLALMKKGARWQLYVPSELAYGDQEQGQIKPGSTLIFDVELIDIKSK
jgi:FKBP-type peptidyl-prolyl cis-trans isomerase FklB